METSQRGRLPKELKQRLEHLGQRLHWAPLPLLHEVLDRLGACPADRAIAWSGEIALAAKLWRHTGKPQLWPVSLFAKDDAAVLASHPDYAWLFLFHGDGRLREAALKRINVPPTTPFFLAALVWRLNDWARPVRSAAVDCANRVLSGTDAAVLAEVAALIAMRRLSWGRWNEERAVFDAAIERQDVMDALVARLRGSSTGPVGGLMATLLQFRTLDRHLDDLALHAAHPSVRAIALTCLIAGEARWIVGREWVWIDKTYGVRRSRPSFRSRAIVRPESIDTFVHAGLTDRSVLVRRKAADALIKARAECADLAALTELVARDPKLQDRARFLETVAST